MLNEADTRAKLIDPKLHEAGWDEDRIQRSSLKHDRGGIDLPLCQKALRKADS